MAYESFTLDTFKAQFGLTYTQTSGARDVISPIAPSVTLTAILKRHVPLVVGRTSGKGRSEFLVAPILTEVRDILD
ncbi:MAG: hypothetical protein H7Y38_15180 [Armatimonadetes bacterium]|nr:hypothetical protein [Armatimonadota bacterium]